MTLQGVEDNQTSQAPLTDYRDRGARALVILHEREMRYFIAVWREATAAGIKLPATKDPAYQSLDQLLRHVLGAARGYITWICSKLELPDPAIEPTPAIEEIAAECGDYLEHLLARWRIPLKNITEDQMYSSHESRWKVSYCVDAMLEHAVMHPVRHAFQLTELMRRGL